MILIICFSIVGLVLLGSIFCITLIGGPPWSKGAEGALIKIGEHRLSVLQVSLGLMLLIFGLLWLVTWFYLVTAYRDVIFGQWDLLALHYSLQLPLAFVLSGSGIAVLRNWKKWRGAYLTCVILLALSVAGSFFLEPTTEPVRLLFRYILPVIALAVVGGIALFLYVIKRTIEFETVPPKSKRAS